MTPEQTLHAAAQKLRTAADDGQAVIFNGPAAAALADLIAASAAALAVARQILGDQP